MEEAHRLFRLLLEELRISVSKIKLPIRSMADFPDMGLRSHFYGDSAQFCESLPDVTWHKNELAKIYMLQDCYLCRYILNANDEADGCCWIAGPYLTEEPASHGITALCQNLRLPSGSFHFFQSYYRMLPKLHDQHMLESLLRIEASLRYEDRGFEFLSWDMGMENLLPVSEHMSKPPLAYKRFTERNYTIEANMMECISEGNYSGAMALYTRLQQSGLDQKTDSILRNGKNALIVLNTLCRIAGYNGGVPAESLDKCAREFMIQIESKTTLQGLQNLRSVMIKKYCELARLNNTPPYSTVIQKAIDLISGSFDSAISLRDMAEQLNISPSYLSTLFKKEVGVSFSKYIIEKRLNFAKELLLRTKLPINTIALECGIADNNYFSRIFKAQTGMTPAQFRLRGDLTKGW